MSANERKSSNLKRGTMPREEKMGLNSPNRASTRKLGKIEEKETKNSAAALLPPGSASTKNKQEDANRPRTVGRRASIPRGDSLQNLDNLNEVPSEVKKTPLDQVSLTPEQLGEIFTKVITANNPNISKTLTRFSFAEGAYKLETNFDHLAVHFVMDSTLIHVHSDEEKVSRRNKEDAAEEAIEQANTGTSTGDNCNEGPEGQVLRNQFNFSERATQTFNNVLRDREVATEPPPTTEASGNVTQWEIFDTYLADFEKTVLAPRREANQVKVKTGKVVEEEMASRKVLSGNQRILESPKLINSLRTMERLVNLNMEEESYYQFKHFQENDNGREDGKGEFLPLWKFSYSKSKRKTVTALAWNGEHMDLFAVGFGSYEFLKQSTGLICCFSLKNTSYPEFTFSTVSGVVSLEFHPKFSFLLAVGLYNGLVCVYDVRKKSNEPLFISSDPTRKHSDPVWQVHWELSGKDLSFYSVSSDGRVMNWTLSKDQLIAEEIMVLKLSQRAQEKEKENGEGPLGLAGGACFDFNLKSPDLFVVGTEEGSVQSYSRAYANHCLEQYVGHQMAVYTVKWNPFHPQVFISASADWTVKIWESSASNPAMTFDLQNSVSDVAWAPFSSTVFAAVTADGKVRLFDFSINKHEPIGETRVTKKSRLTKISFHPTEPIILVSDDSGVVICLKLSPNMKKPLAKGEVLSATKEIEKLEKVLLLAEVRLDPRGLGKRPVTGRGALAVLDAMSKNASAAAAAAAAPAQTANAANSVRKPEGEAADSKA